MGKYVRKHEDALSWERNNYDSGVEMDETFDQQWEFAKRLLESLQRDLELKQQQDFQKTAEAAYYTLSYDMDLLDSQKLAVMRDIAETVLELRERDAEKSGDLK